MSFIYPAISAILQASSLTIDKITLSIKKVTYKTYNGVSFPLIFLFTLIIFLIFRPPLSLDLFQGKYLIFIIISIILLGIVNLAFYRALKSDTLTELQTISLLKSIPLILVSSFVFKDERNFLIIFLALIAVVAIVWSHWQRDHFHIAKKTWPFFILVLIATPLRGIISKILLEIWNPISLQLIRDGIIALIFIPLFFKNIKKTPKKAFPLLLLTNLFTTIAWILYLFSYQISGIVYTVLIFSLQPLLVYLASLFFLKEKFHWKKCTAFAIILIAIVMAQIWR